MTQTEFNQYMADNGLTTADVLEFLLGDIDRLDLETKAEHRDIERGNREFEIAKRQADPAYALHAGYIELECARSWIVCLEDPNYIPF